MMQQICIEAIWVLMIHELTKTLMPNFQKQRSEIDGIGNVRANTFSEVIFGCEGFEQKTDLNSQVQKGVRKCLLAALRLHGTGRGKSILTSILSVRYPYAVFIASTEPVRFSLSTG